jgi:photosystem II stability/assembly factor-like uncharacterized protein
MDKLHKLRSHPSQRSGYAMALALGLALLFQAAPASASLSPDWHFSSAYPTQNSLNAIWAENTNSVYVAGDGGVIFHWDGTTWTEMETPTERPLFSIHGTSSDNIWAVGGDSYQSTNDDKSVVLHYDGSSWLKMPPPVDWAGQSLTLSDVWVQSPTEVWAIIESYLSLFKWDGTKWNNIDFQGAIPGAFPEGSMNDVQWVDGLGLFMVGTHGQVIHFDGTNWTLEQKLEEGNFSINILTTIHAIDADHVYAGHNWVTVFKRNPDGTWTDLELGEGGFFGSGQILDIRGNSPDDLYFFVDRTIRHFTGAAPTQNTEYGNEVRGSWQAADAYGDQLFVVDNEGGVYQFDTTSSTLSPLAFSHGSYFNGRLNGATASGDDDILLFGNGLNYQDPAMALATSNGSTVTRYPTEGMPEDASHSANVIDAASRPDGEFTIVFDDFQTGRSGIYTKESSGWIRRQGDYFTSNDLQLDYSSSGRLHMCDSQRVAYWPDSDSTAVEILRLPLEQASQEYFTALWAPTNDRIFVGGYDGQIRRWDGADWSPETIIADTEIGALIGDDNQVYAIAFDDGSFRDTGQLWYRSAAGSWSRIPLAQDLSIKPIGFARGNDGIYFAYATPGNYTGGGRTFITRLEGATTVGEVNGLSSQYEAITSNAQGDIFLIHSSGYFLTNRQKPATFTYATVPLQANIWNGLDLAGVEVAPASTTDGHSFFVGWRSLGVTSSSLIPARYQPGGEQWVLDHNSARPPENTATFRFRFAYDPALLPAAFDPSRAVMLRFDGSVWEAIPAVVNEAAGYIETTAPTSTSTWVIAVDLDNPIDIYALSITLEGASSITLNWPASIPLTLYSSPTLAQGSWVPVTDIPARVDDQMTLTIPKSGTHHYFRLAE